MKVAAVESETIDPFQPNIEVGSVVNQAEAKTWSHSRHNDIRPRLFDKGEKLHRLVDTGSMISTTSINSVID